MKNYELKMFLADPLPSLVESSHAAKENLNKYYEEAFKFVGQGLPNPHINSLK